MAKVRSPSYPAISLPEAVEKIKMVYEKDYQNKIDRELVAKHMGYQSLNGKSLGVLAAVAKYGLLEGRGDANWVSDLALNVIAHAPGSPERAHSVAEAGRRPELFSALDVKFQNGRASDAALRSYLLTQKFIPAAADLAIRSYRETKAFVSQESGSYTEGGDPPSEPESETMQTASAPTTTVGQSLPVAALFRGEREFLRGPLSNKSGYRLLISGDMGAKELGKLIRILQLQQELLEDSDAEAEGSNKEEGGNSN